MNSRERFVAAINHKEPDRIPIELGATATTGISASTLYKLRKALGLPEKPVVISELLQMLGGVDDDLRKRLGVDVVGLFMPTDLFGNDRRCGLAPYTMSDGTPVLLPESVQYHESEDGYTYLYPKGDRSVPPSGKMPKGGFFFDNIDRSPGFDEDNLTPAEDFKDAFSIIDDDTAKYLEKESHRLYNETDYGIIGNLGGGGLGDSAILPGPHEKSPKGIRKYDDWLTAHLLYPEYINEVFSIQTEFMLKNLEIYKQAVGDRIQVVWISGTDFGTQNGCFINPQLFRELYLPHFKRMNDWVHANTNWKTLFHSCGSIVDFLDDFVKMGVDIINPVQLSAKGMDAATLKERYGNDLVFWGAGVDTQATLPFSGPCEVYEQVKERVRILGRGGGFVFNTIHNIVAKTPVENVIAAFDAALGK